MGAEAATVSSGNPVGGPNLPASTRVAYWANASGAARCTDPGFTHATSSLGYPFQFRLSNFARAFGDTGCGAGHAGFACINTHFNTGSRAGWEHANFQCVQHGSWSIRSGVWSAGSNIFTAGVRLAASRDASHRRMQGVKHGA